MRKIILSIFIVLFLSINLGYAGPSITGGSSGVGWTEKSDCSTVTTLGQGCYDDDDYVFCIGNGTSCIPVETPLATISKSSSGNLSVLEVSGRKINNYGQTVANTQTFPTAADKMSVLFEITTTGVGAFNAKAGASDKIMLDDTWLDDGDKASCATPALGDTLSCWTIKTGASAWDWICYSGKGTWTDGGQ